MFNPMVPGADSPFQPRICRATTDLGTYHPFAQAQFHRASESQLHFHVRQIEALCPHVFGCDKQAFASDIASEVHGMLCLLQQFGRNAGDTLGPARLDFTDADLRLLAQTITTDQIDSMREAFGLIELSLAQVSRI